MRLDERMNSKKQQLNFNQDFIFLAIEEWKKAAEIYKNVSQIHYKKIRSYLSLWQFRLNESTKCDLREQLALHLDEITEHDFVHDLDTYLEGFCFQLDKSVFKTTIPTDRPKEVNIKIASNNDENLSYDSKMPDSTDHDFNGDYQDESNSDQLDYYTQQFFE